MATAKNILLKMAETTASDPTASARLPPLLIRGAPGCGKSTIVREVAKELKIGFVDIRLAEMERVDICGLPSVENGMTKWNVPSIWPQDPESKGIILLDEITSAPPDCQVAAYQILLERTISNSDYVIPKGWFIVGAGNRTLDKAVVKPMSSAMANRFAHIEVEPNSEDWIVWAITHGVHPSVTGFIQYRPDKLFSMTGQNLEGGWPSPRSWERVSNVINLFDVDSLRSVVYGLVGTGVGLEFMEFHRINKNFDDVLEVLTNPKKKVIIPGKADERYAMASAVTYLVWNGQNENDDLQRVSGLFRVCMDMPADFATLIVKNAMVGNGRVTRQQAIQYLAHAPEFKEYTAKYGSSASKAMSL